MAHQTVSVPSSEISTPEIDFTVQNCGSIFIVSPETEYAREWVKENIRDRTMWVGVSFIVEHRYIEDILEGILDDGMAVSRG